MTTATRLSPDLTDREVQVIRGAANGLSNAEIGRELFLAENTVKTHMRRASKKLGATGRAHVVAIALKQGVLTLRDVQPSSGPPNVRQAPPQAVRRVRHLIRDWQHTKPPAPHLANRWWDHKLTQLATAVADPQEPTP